MIQIIPAIDIMDGRCVRLSQGAFESRKTYDCLPSEMAARYADCGVGRIHMVDLDGAKKGSPVNLRSLEEAASRTGIEIEWGGGIAAADSLKSVFDAGATQAIIGSTAVRKPELMSSWLKGYGPSAIILGADVRGRNVAVSGWLEDSEVTIDALIERFLPDGLSQVICTDISRDGMLQGPSFALYEELQSGWPDIDFTVSGGIGSMYDVRELDSMGLRKVIVGKAIYEGKISLKELEQWSQNA